MDSRSHIKKGNLNLYLLWIQLVSGEKDFACIML